MLHKIRDKDGGTKEFEWTPLQAIRHFCYECLGWEGDPKKECVSTQCPLFPKRGRPKGWQGARKPMSEERRVANRKRLARARESAAARKVLDK